MKLGLTNLRFCLIRMNGIVIVTIIVIIVVFIRIGH